MDAPPPKEDCRPFVDIAGRLSAAGLNVPKIIEQQLEQGFLLLSDLGPTTYYDKIISGAEDSTLQKMYREALAALVTMQAANHEGLPHYDAPRLKQELSLFVEWYTTIHCKTTLTTRDPAIPRYRVRPAGQTQCCATPSIRAQRLSFA
jgi:N-acetylmuramate 1-kinase